MTEFKDKIVTVEWKSHKIYAFLASVSINGIDRQGVLYEIAKVIHFDLKVNIRSISIDASNGVFKGKIDLYVYNKKDLDNLISNIKKIKGIKTVNRTEIKN
jgi:GTP pyrophosphokinase